MASAALTDELVRDHRYAGGTDYLWHSPNGLSTGFALRTHPSGKKSWVVKVGASIQTLGNYPTFTLEEAHLAARRLQQQYELARVGLPQPSTDAGPKTVADLATRHEAWAQPPRRKQSWADDLGRRYREALLPQWGHRILATLTADELELWHQQQAHRKVWANRAMQALRAGWTHAERWGWVAPASSPLRAFGLWRWPEKARERVLTHQEAVAIRGALEAMGGDPGALGCRLILMTGMRHQEAASLRWRAVRLEERVLVLDEHKTSRKHGAKVIPLPGAALELLMGLERGEPSMRVFGLHHFYRAWHQARAIAGAPDVTIHDARRTLATRLDGDGLSVKGIADQLGQRTTRITQDHYIHPDLERRRQVAERGAELMAK